jgi:hypothetical protein
MGSSADIFITAFLFLIAINIAVGLITGVTPRSAACGVVNINACWSDVGYPPIPGSYSFLGLNMTPIVAPFLWLGGLLTLIASFFVVYISFPNVFGGVISTIQIILEVFLVRGILW